MKDCFTFANIICRLCAKLNDAFHYFNEEEEFMDLLGQISGGEEAPAEEGENEEEEEGDNEDEDVDDEK